MVQVSTRYSASRSAGESHAIIFLKIVVFKLFYVDCCGFKIREQRFFQFLSCIVKRLPLTADLVLYECISPLYYSNFDFTHKFAY